MNLKSLQQQDENQKVNLNMMFKEIESINQSFNCIEKTMNQIYANRKKLLKNKKRLEENNKRLGEIVSRGVLN